MNGNIILFFPRRNGL